MKSYQIREQADPLPDNSQEDSIDPCSSAVRRHTQPKQVNVIVWSRKKRHPDTESDDGESQ